MPSACGAFTFVFSSSSLRTAAISLFSAAAAKGASAAALTPAATNNNAAAAHAVNRLMLMSIDSARLDGQGLEKFIDLAVAIGKRIEPHANLVEQREMQIRQ